MFKRKELYTQGTNECTLVTLKNIVRTQYGIIMNDTLGTKLITMAENSGIWSRDSGAIFTFIYNRFTGWFNKQYGVEVDVKEVDILSQEFEDMVKQGYSFGLGLQFASNWYKQTRSDGKITIDEVKTFDILQNKRYGHNHTYKHEYIIESLASVDDKTIEFSLEALREAVNMGIYRKTARTIVIKDELINYYALEINKQTNFGNVDTFDYKNRVAFDIAMSLRILHK